jgi:sugar lactone lactonase YvrE
MIVIHLSCSQSPETYTVETIDGVKHIHNLAPKWGDEPEIGIEFVKKIGGLESLEDHLLFFRPSGFAVDSQGNRYVMDSGNFRIVKFDRDWNFGRIIGREGQGPGEFEQYVRGLDIDSKDRLWAHNPLTRRTQIISPAGKYLGGFSHQSIRVFYSRYTLLENDCIAAALTINPFLENYDDEFIIKIFDESGECVAKAGDVFVSDEKLYIEIYNATYIDAAGNNTVVAAFQYMNKIAKYSTSGETLWIADRPLNYPIRHNVKDNITTEPAVGIAVDAKGRSWVLTFIKQPVSNQGMPNTLKDHDIIVFEIFDENGILLGSIPTPNHVAAIRIFGDHLYIIDTYTEMCVYEYKIVDLQNN